MDASGHLMGSLPKNENVIICHNFLYFKSFQNHKILVNPQNTFLFFLSFIFLFIESPGNYDIKDPKRL